MGEHTVETEDLILLRSIDKRIEHIEDSIPRLEQRIYQLERANPGGRWGVIIERLLIAVIAMLLGHQNIHADDVERVLHQSVTHAPVSAPTSAVEDVRKAVATSTIAR